MAIEIKVKFIIVSFQDEKNHNAKSKEYQDAINDGWAVDATHQFDFALVYELKKYVVVKP